MLRSLTLALALAASPTLADTITLTTNRGDVAVPSDPAKVAVFDMAALDTLEALGVQVAGTTSNVYLDYLEDSAAEAEIVGTLFEPDLEALNALQPDLIIAGGRSVKQIPNLEQMGATVDMTINDVVADGLARLTTYGALFGKESEAAALQAAFDRKKAQVQAATANAGKALIVMTNGPKVSAYGTKGRFGWLHTAFGLTEAVDDVEQATHGEAISFEFIRDANPDVLLVIDRAAAIGQGASAKETLDNALVRDTNAWKTGKVIYLSSGPIYIAAGGIQSMTLTMDELLAAFSGS